MSQTNIFKKAKFLCFGCGEILAAKISQKTKIIKLPHEAVPSDIALLQVPQDVAPNTSENVPIGQNWHSCIWPPLKLPGLHSEQPPAETSIPSAQSKINRPLSCCP